MDPDAGHRTDERRAELKAAHGLLRAGPARDVLPVAGPDEQCEGRPGTAQSHAAGKMPLEDKGYDADWFREAFAYIGIAACIPARRRRKNPAVMAALSIAKGTGSKTSSGA